MLATWKDSYCTGHVLVDAQHREIFDLVNQLSDAIVARRGHELVGDVLGRLERYAEEHFAAEEQLMRRASYPDLVRHIGLHEAFRVEVTELASAFRSGELVLPLTLCHFVLEWLREHIRAEDLALVAWLHGEGARYEAAARAAR